jgi:hypothetical protein
MGTLHCGHLQTDQPLSCEPSRRVTDCFARQEEHVSGSWEHVLKVGKLRYSGIVSVHMTHSFLLTSARLRLLATLSDFEVWSGACERFLLAMTVGEMV